MSEARQLALGREAEHAWLRLRVAIEQEARFAATLWRVEAADARAFSDAVAELEARLEALGPLTRIELGTHAAEQVIDAGAAGAGGHALPIALAVLSDPTSDASKGTLASLNVRRDHLGSGGPVYLVVVSHGGDYSLAPDLASVAVGPLRLKVAPAAAASGGPIGFVHLSDFHLNARDWTQMVVIDALVRDLPGLVEKAGIVPHLIFGTGDFAYAGKPEEFDRAQALLHKLQMALAPLVPAAEQATGGVEPRGPTEYAAPRVYVVPGNHDVDRNQIRRFDRLGLAELLEAGSADAVGARKQLGGWWAPRASAEPEAGTAVELAADKLDAFYTFGARAMGAARAIDPGQAWRVDRQVVRGVAIGTLSLNTAWSCLPTDQPGSILVGERQVRDALHELEQLGGADVTIALLHHPPRWWPEFERRGLRDLLRRHCDLVLTGHEHDADPMSHESGTNRVLHLAGGAVHAGGAWYNGCQVGSIDPATGQVTVHMFRYSDSDGGFWARDTLQRQGSDGRLVFDLGRTLGGGGTAAPEAGASDALVRRLCDASASVLNRVDFIGIPATAAGKRQASIDAVFVPLEAQGRDEKRESTEQMVERLASRQPPEPIPRIEIRKDDGTHASSGGRLSVEVIVPDDPFWRAAASFAVLGAPGAGKSTLLRYLAWQATQWEKPRVPLLIPLRDWVARGEHQPLLAFAAGEMSRVLSTPVSSEQLEALAERGDALLLIDGLDEVPADSMRVDVRDMVAALAKRFHRLPIVCSSRITGYDRAPLPGVFEHLTLAPFDDEQLGAFVRRWYTLQCPDDSRTRNEQIAGLETAFDAEPRAKQLARNPLFATLIAMVHYAEATLPGDRATLYEKLVEMLLVTWPRTSGARVFGDPRLPPGRQREVLERLAFHLQSSRVGRGGPVGALGEAEGAVTIERAALQQFATDVIAEVVELEHYDSRELASSWIEYVAARTGVLVEQSPGVFAFLHLSVLEYLAGQRAARVWGAGGTDALAEGIVARVGQDHWVETLLLLLGADAKNRPLADAVLRGVVATGTAEDDRAIGPLIFGLRALRDEVECSASVRTALLERVARDCGDEWYAGHAARDVLDEVVAFSRLHGEALSHWFEPRLGRARGHELARLALVAPTALLRVVAERDDATWHVRDGLVSPGAADVVAVIRGEPAPPRPVDAAIYSALTGHAAVDGLALPSPDLAFAAIIGSLRGFAHAAGATTQRMRGELRAAGKAAFALNVGRAIVSALPPDGAARLAHDIGVNVAQEAPPSLAGNLAHSIAVNGARNFEPVLDGDVTVRATRDDVLATTQSVGFEFAFDCALSVFSNMAFARVRVVTLSAVADLYHHSNEVDDEGSGESSLELAFNDARRIAWELASTFAQRISFGPRASETPTSWPLVTSDVTIDQGADVVSRSLTESLAPLMTAISGHVVLGLFASDGFEPALSAERAYLAVSDRILSLWHGMYHTAICKYLLNDRGDTAETRAALAASAVFAMQYNHRWPDSEWFAAWRAAGEPEHYREAWWWHLCNGIDDAENPAHMERAAAALDRAPDDDEHREIVRFLRALNIQPCTQADMDAQLATMKENWLNLVRANRDAGMEDPYMGWAEAGCWMLEE